MGNKYKGELASPLFRIYKNYETVGSYFVTINEVKASPLLIYFQFVIMTNIN
jgi:hypothetical protein